MWFFGIFVLIPLAEIMVFIAVSKQIGFFMAFLLTLLAAILGGSLIKYQGMQTMLSAQSVMRDGRLPSDDLFDALCVVVAGLLLLTPGFISDGLGVLLLLPPVRAHIRNTLAKSGNFSSMSFNAEYAEFHDAKAYHRPQDPDIIEAEFEILEKEDKS